MKATDLNCGTSLFIHKERKFPDGRVLLYAEFVGRIIDMNKKSIILDKKSHANGGIKKIRLPLDTEVKLVHFTDFDRYCIVP